MGGASVGLSTLSHAPQLRGQLDTASGKVHRKVGLLNTHAQLVSCPLSVNVFLLFTQLQLLQSFGQYSLASAISHRFATKSSLPTQAQTFAFGFCSGSE